MAKNLESIVNSGKRTWVAKKLNNPKRGLLGKIFDYGIGAAATAAAYSIIGMPAVVAAGVAIAGDYVGNLWRGKKTTSAQIRDSLVLSSIFSPIVYNALGLINQHIDVKAHYGLLKRSLAQLGLLGTIGPIANHADYLLRHKTLDITEAYEQQFKKFFFRNIGWSALANTVPVSLDYLGFGVDSQFYGGLGAGVIVRGLAWGRQIAALDPYGTYNNKAYAQEAKPKNNPKPAYNPKALPQAA
ncbi:hypothetical protein HYY71_01145 [Candidatus Woesearchaeota archaeon]|nr:hypothetical protein [Candidatus Woesearchaeota archaeon]